MDDDTQFDDDTEYTLIISVHAQEQIRRRVRGGAVSPEFLDELARIASTGYRDEEVRRDGLLYVIRDGVLVTVFPCGATKRRQNRRMFSR